MLRRAALLAVETEPTEFQGANVIPQAWKNAETISDGWSKIVQSCKDGTYKTRYSLGQTKIADFGMYGLCMMKIIGFDQDTLTDGSGKAPITWASKNALLLTAGYDRLSYTVLDNKFLNYLPTGLKNSLREVTKHQTVSSGGQDYSSRLFGLSSGEVLAAGGSVAPEDVSDNSGTYKVNYINPPTTVRVTGLTPNGGPTCCTWTRSYSRNREIGCCYSHSGFSTAPNYLKNLYVAPCFCT